MRASRLPVLLPLFLVQMVLCRLRHSSPLHCSRCGPGWGVEAHCTAFRDTLCVPCAAGSYSPHHSYHASCWPCARCGPGLYQAHACTPFRDTVCDSCQRLRKLHNSNTEYDEWCK